MHFVRVIPALVIGAVSVLYSTKAVGALDDIMTKEEQQKTGVDHLTDPQKQALETWINDKLALKTPPPKKWVYLSENLNNGAQLRMSDGSLYAIAPQDQQRTSVWLTPFAAKFDESGDPNFPVKITNTITNVSVSAKQTEPPKN